MEIPVLNEGQLDRFKLHLIEEERSPNTIEKYSRDVRALLANFPGEVGFTKEMILDYKQCLLEKYKTTSVNSMLVAINQFFRFCKREHPLFHRDRRHWQGGPAGRRREFPVLPL